jgi:hypothetical protein
MRSTAVKAIVIVLAVLILLWIASELIIPRVAASYAEREIRKRYPQATDVSVSVRAFPALKLAFKQYSRLRVSADNITLEGVNFDSIQLDSPGWPGGTFEAVIGATEINRFFSLATSYLVEPRVQLQGNTLRITGLINAGGSTVQVDATGTLHALNGKNVYFVPQDVVVGGVRFNEAGVSAVKEIMARTPIFTVRQNLPFDITGTVIEQGKLRITGNVNLEKALNFKL